MPSITGAGVDVPLEHHPTIGDVISNRYLKVMFKIPKKGHLPTPQFYALFFTGVNSKPQVHPSYHRDIPMGPLNLSALC